MKTMKMKEFFTAKYSDGRTLYEQTLPEVYEKRNGAAVTIEPSIWLWGGNGVYFVDYVGLAVGCTLGCFDSMEEAAAYQRTVQEMSRGEFERWNASRGHFWAC